MLCFRPGCGYGIGDPGGVEVIIRVGTRGIVGASEAKISFSFCSTDCMIQFFMEYQTHEEIIKAVIALHNKQGGNMIAK